MRVAFIFLVLSIVPAEADAISRLESTSLACEDLRAKVREEGAVILRFNSKKDPSIELYERFVRDSRYCEYVERAKTTYVPAADTDSCRVFHCVAIDRDNGGPLTILPRR
ncbi:MAG: hypothetical protein JNL61_21815 [Rhizobiaceae bacterium]|nr:hypothetical protein [Rhizobiaceae bacterium]